MKKAKLVLPNLTRQRQVADLYRQLANTTNNISTEFSALLNVSELGCGRAEDYCRMANILVKTNQLTRALDFYYQAAKLAPKNANYRARFGYCLFRLNRTNQAGAQFRRALKIDPKNPLATLGIAFVELDSNPQSARAKINQILTDDPSMKSLVEEIGIEIGDF